MRMIPCAIGALGLCAGSLTGQAPAGVPGLRLTLAEARSMAQRTSPELAVARQALAAARGRERQAGAFPNPILAYGREQTSRAGQTASQNILSLEQRFEIGGQRGARQQAAGLLRAAAEARMRAVAAQVDYDVTRSYAATVAADRRSVLVDEAAQAFANAGRVSGERLAVGDISGYEDRRLRLEAARYTALRLATVVARDSAVRILVSLIGLADSAARTGVPLLVDTLTPAPLALAEDSLVARALASRPELRAARLEAEAGQAEVGLAQAERIPTPALSGGFKNERITTGESLNGFVLGLSLPLPLWDRRGGAIDAARADAASRTAELEGLRRQTIREVRSAFEAHQAIAGQLAALQEQLGDDAAKARQAAGAAYGEGEIGLLEWLDAVRAYQEAEAAYAALWAEYIARRGALERVTGATLF
ncbi:MAG: TolC family protein [Gemmatimonadales bacterium]